MGTSLKPHNDFIGAIIYEELGIIGLGLIIIPTCIIIFKLLNYSQKIKENKSRIILLGIASYFFLHLLINLGGVSGLIPMTGVPLLFISSGDHQLLQHL
ncbi:FtsW/RodA/SpoVE family cell cycle protein [Coprobacillaceae bacterium CR2/5/TPMF4]|nr:FtsW/RodA/SpoVE family cell cycle protein [Coprobacillaceae bacterium CR2/5/TPMF4]